MNPDDIVNKMMKGDAFSKLLGMEVLETGHGVCRIKMTVTANMLNGFGIAHGGITYSLADSALAFASNSGGRKSVSIETSISHIKSLNEGDVIIAEANRESETEKIGHYRIKVSKENEPDTVVALFLGIVYRTAKNWD